MKTRYFAVAVIAALAGGCDSGPCSGVSGTCVAFDQNANEAKIQTAFATATANTTFVFAAGTFSFTNELTVTTDNVTIKGAGMDKTILDFTNQTAGSEGMLVMNGGFTIRDLTVKNSVGNGVKVVGATGVTYQRVHVMWTDPDGHKHGPYGLYPVQCENVLVEDCVVEGANDAGVYVGQSNHVIVRGNTVHNNVAGIEIENCHFADVYSNEAHDNTAGVLVFALPGLQQKDCHDVRVHENTIHDNNTPNFASPGDIVEIVPAGTGTFVMASDNVEVFQNTYTNNQTANFAIINYLDSGMDPMDPGYYPYPTRVYVHDNTFMGGGDKPDTSMGKISIGGLLALSLPMFPGMKDGDIMYDGVVDTMRTGMSTTNPMDICIGDNGGATFLNLHFDQLNLQKGFVAAEADVTPYQCTLPPVDAVTL